ncbi:MAG: fucose isomerase, partial [Candidatus Omnitrophica bacterium]|nr:fucose isomerase [Candidatus Omnitrophota bacterium]
MIQNIPEVKLGLIAVSRDCFIISLSQKRRKAIADLCKGALYECPITVENEKDVLVAVE